MQSKHIYKGIQMCEHSTKRPPLWLKAEENADVLSKMQFLLWTDVDQQYCWLLKTLTHTQIY